MDVGPMDVGPMAGPGDRASWRLGVEGPAAATAGPTEDVSDPVRRGHSWRVRGGGAGGV